MEALALPGIEEYAGALYKLPSTSTELEAYRSLYERLGIIRAADEVEKKAELAAADSRFVQGSQWNQIFKTKQWGEEGYERQEEWFKTQAKPLRTARDYATFYQFCVECDRQEVARPTSIMQVKAFEGRGLLEERVQLWDELTEGSDPLGGRKLRKAIEEKENRRALADSKEATKDKTLANAKAQDGNFTGRVTLPNGMEVTVEEAAEYYRGYIETLTKEKEKAEKARRQAETAKEQAKNAKEKAKKQLQEAQAKVNKEFRQAVENSFNEQLLELYARYDIQETPTIFEVDGEAFQQALSNTRDRREEEILEIVSNFFPFVSKIRQYEPDEAARAALKWPSEERAKEAVQEIADWFNSMGGEMDVLTTPGVLRAVERNGE